MDPDARWYVIHTHPQGEAMALRNLERQGFEAYLPRYIKHWRHARRVEQRLTPLFPRYLFVRFEVARASWRSINSTIGVASLICRGDEPAPVPYGVVEEIQAREGGDGVIQVRLTQFRKGERVQVASGPLVGAVGLFECLSDDDRIVLLLDLLGRKMRVAISADLATAPI